jgi:hypothetical protein
MRDVSVITPVIFPYAHVSTERNFKDQQNCMPPNDSAVLLFKPLAPKLSIEQIFPDYYYQEFARVRIVQQPEPRKPGGAAGS